MAPFTVTISTSYEEFWRYNLVVMAEVLREGRCVEMLKDRIDVAPVGSELSSPPEGYVRRDINLKSVPGDAITLYIYIIPHTLPRANYIVDAQPFELRVEVMLGDKSIHAHTHEVNQWSGENISFSYRSSLYDE